MNVCSIEQKKTAKNNLSAFVCFLPSYIPIYIPIYICMSIYFNVYQFLFKNVHMYDVRSEYTVYEINLFVKEVRLKLKYLF